MENMRGHIIDKIAEFSKPVEGTDCTVWTGPVSGAGTPQIWFGGESDTMARTVAQCVHYLETGDDLNNSGYIKVRTCDSVGCSNPKHYELQVRKSPTIKIPKKKTSKLTIIPKWQLREKAFNDIKSFHQTLDNISFLSEKYNIPRTLVRKIMDNKAIIESNQ